jgi:hypothetical protein
MEVSDTRKSQRSDNSLKTVGELFGRFGWNTRLSELDEEKILMFIMLCKEEIGDLENEFNETYLAAIWFKYTLK